MNRLETMMDLKLASDAVKAGRLILYPTDTIWGIGCDATNSTAVARVFALKRRCDAKALISLTDSIESLRKWVEIIPQAAEEKMKDSNRPITIIYDSPNSMISPLLKASDGSVAFRVPALEFTKLLCEMAGKPIVSTSANISGESYPRCFEEIGPELLSGVDYICNYGRELKNETPSRIYKISNDNVVTVIRE